MSIRGALDQLLKGTGYRAVAIDAHSFRVVKAGSGARPVTLPGRRASGNSATPSDVIVTGSKQRLSLLRYPGSVVVIDPGARSPRAAANDLTELAQQTPVLQSTELGPGRNKVFIRGIADSSFNGSAQSTASIYLDDVQLGYSGPDPGLKLYDIGEVEVLEGPQGTLYGSGAIGGIVRLTSNHVDLNARGGSLAAGVIGTAGGAPGGELSGVVNVPILAGTVGLRLVGYRSTDGGYVDDVGRRLNNVNRVDTTGGRATLLVEPGGDWRIELAGLAQDIDGRDAQYADARVGPLARRSLLAQPFRNSIQSGRVLIGKSWRNSGLQLTSATGLVGNSTLDRFDASSATPISRAAYQASGSKLLVSHETRLSRSLANGDSWVAGFTLLRDRDSLVRSFTAAGAERPIIGVTNLTRSASLFAEATHALTRSFAVTLGGRLTAARTDGEPSTTPRSNSYVRGRSTLRIDPTVAFSWGLRPGWALFGRYQSGFRTGGLAVARGVGKVADFRSDAIQVEEIGLRKLRTATTGLAFSTSLSLARWNNIQADLTNRRGQPYTNNVGNAGLQTAELNADWVPIQGLHATVAMLATHNRVTGSVAELSRAANRRLPETPTFTARGGLFYEWECGLGPMLSVGGSGGYISPSVLGVGDLLDVRQGGYGTAQLGAGARWRRLDLSVALDNVTDARGNRFAYGNPFLLPTRSLTTPLRPINLALRAAVSW